MILNTLGISYKWNHTVFICLFISLSMMSSRFISIVACDTTRCLFFFFLLRVNNISLCFPGGSVVKNVSTKQETWIQSLSWEDPLEKEMATHSSILPGKSHGQRSLVGYRAGDHKASVGHDWVTEHADTHTRVTESLFCTPETNTVLEINYTSV